jgi:hypothetical protein
MMLAWSVLLGGSAAVAQQEAAGAAVALGVMGVVLLLYLVMIAAAIAGTIFWIFALVDCAQREFPGPNDKLMWILIVALLHWIGALVYWFVGRPRGWKPGQAPPASV